jgi:membrane protein implicated in regulation of membrane protease activity
MDWLTDNFWLAWLGIAIVLAAVEAATVDFVFVMFAGGALFGALAAVLGAPFWLQVVVAVVAALLLVGLVRPMIRRKFLEGEVDHRIGAAGLVGRRAWVLQAVTETDGRVKLAGETWSARLAEGSPPAGPGDEVRVIAIHGATAIVTALPPADPAPPPSTDSPT